MVRIGEERTERLDIVPAKLRVLVTIRPKYACRVCEQGVIQAPALAHLIEGGLPTEGTIAQVLVSKYADHCPLYRQSQIYARSGVELHRSTLADWVGKASFHLRPVAERLAEHLKRLDEAVHGRDARAGARPRPGQDQDRVSLGARARGPRLERPGPASGGVPVRAGARGTARRAVSARPSLASWQVDAYAGYHRLTTRANDPLTLALCWAHARRKLREVFDHDHSPVAAEGLRRIAEMYAIEADIRGASPEQRLAERHARTAPLVEAFAVWLHQQRLRVSAKSRLGQKLGYIDRHFDGLRVFLDDGRVEIDSNAVENSIRPLALNRKNALFAGHDEGAAAWGRIASLIETAKMNGVEPYAYLKTVLEAIAAGHPVSKIDELLPWAFTPSSP